MITPSNRLTLPAVLIEEIAERYLDSLLAGEHPDRRAIVEAHSDIAYELDRRLALVDLLFAARPRPSWPR
jgi:hypothetical protein